MSNQSTDVATIVPSIDFKPPFVVQLPPIESGVEQQYPAKNALLTNHEAVEPILQSQPPQLVVQPTAPQQPASNHVPYLVNQAQQQFALMEEQYAQHMQQQEHQKIQEQQKEVLPVPHFAMDMGDSDSGSMQLNPDGPSEVETIDNHVAPSNNPLIDLASEPSLAADVPAIPISHLLAGNAYPSLTKPVPAGIAQSFAPMYVQPNTPIQQGGDIYNDYVQNPYNLVLQTLDQDHHPVVNGSAEHDPSPFAPSSTTTVPHPVANVFQSANYFDTEQSARIPPGSEMLFSTP